MAVTTDCQVSREHAQLTGQEIAEAVTRSLVSSRAHYGESEASCPLPATTKPEAVDQRRDASGHEHL